MSTPITSHKYMLLKGNNHQLIRKVLTQRGNWHEATEDELDSVQLVWSPLNLPARTYHELDERLKWQGTHILLNHFQHNSAITTKSGLTRSLKYFYSHEENFYRSNVHVFESIPTTFIVQAHRQTTEWKSFLERYAQLDRKCYLKEKVPEKHCQHNVWIVKPEAENQGRGIQLFSDLKQIESFLATKPVNSSWIVQKCIEKPLLYQGRKFDIRVWVLVTPQFEVFYYRKAYMRTSSYEYDPTRLQQVVQLTNNCFQKKTEDYQRFESGNTLPLERLQDFLDEHEKYKEYKVDVEKAIVGRIKQLILDSLMCAKKVLYKPKRQKQFQLFGYDFLVDEDLRTWLIEVNNNPYLGTPTTYIKELLPMMVDEMFKIVLDPMFPPEIPSSLESDNHYFTLIHSEPNNISRRLRGERSMAKNYYPLGQISSTVPLKPNSKEQLTTERETTRSKYCSPTESIKNLLQTYCYSDWSPFELPVTLLMNSARLVDVSSVQNNLKSLKLLTETRLCAMLIENKFLGFALRLVKGEFPSKIKQLMLQGWRNCCNKANSRKKILESVWPELLQISMKDTDNLLDAIDEEFLTQVVKLCVALAGSFQRKVFIPGQTRENESVREMFMKQGGLQFLTVVRRQKPEICQKQIVALMDSLEEKDWEVFRQFSTKTQAVSEKTLEFEERKIRPISILRDRNISNTRKSVDIQGTQRQQVSFSEAPQLYGRFSAVNQSRRVQTSKLIKPRTGSLAEVSGQLPLIKK